MGRIHANGAHKTYMRDIAHLIYTSTFGPAFHCLPAQQKRKSSPRPQPALLLPKYMEQDAKQGPSSQSAERAGSGLQARSSSKELRGLGVHAQVHV